MSNVVKNYKLFLASESPRRRELLENAGFIFNVVPVKVSETPNKNLNINEQILDIARRKARAAFESFQLNQGKNIQDQSPFLILSADTEVIFNDAPLGKPKDESDALRILSLLSGQTHQVKTAFCLIESLESVCVSQIETTEVVFKKLTQEDIIKYISTKEPMDKAGAYAIQGLGREFVEKFIGPYDNVVGLPIESLKKLLELQNWVIN